MNTNDPAETEAKLIMDIYEYALDHNLDVENRDDVIQIMKVLNQEDLSDERIERLMTALQITAKKIQSDVDRRKKIN